MASDTVQWASVPWLQSQSETPKTTTDNKGVLDKDDFLKLLIAELKYQDPLEPMKDKEFISQMANFSSLEQMKNLNTGFEKLTQNINNNLIPAFMFQQSANMVGHEVKYVNPESLENETPDILTGKISSVVFKNGIAYYLIDGKQIDPAYILQVGQSTNPDNDSMSRLIEKLDELLELLRPGEGENSE